MSNNTFTATAKTTIRKPPHEVFAAFADAGEMSRFWFTRRDDGLKAGESCTWYLGDGPDAFAFEIRVLEVDHPNKIVIEWNNGAEDTRVTWLFERTDQDDTVLSIEEIGFTGDDDAMIARVLNSTGGFNQVLIAAKALVEHGVRLNVVADRAC